MKSINTLLLMFIVSIGNLFSETITLDTTNSAHFEYSWTGNDQVLCLYIECCDSLKNDDNYWANKSKNFVGCEVVLEPKMGQTILSLTGESLKKTMLNVEVSNNSNGNVNYKIVKENIYNDTNTTEITTETGVVNGPHVDIMQSAVYTTFSNIENGSLIIFQCQ